MGEGNGGYTRRRIELKFIFLQQLLCLKHEIPR